MVIALFESFEIKTLDRQDAGALKTLEPGDLSDSRAEWLFAPGMETQFIENALQEYVEGKSIWAAIWKENLLVGVVAFCEIEPRAKTAGLSYVLGAPWRGQGIMTKACRQLIAYAFKNLDLKTIHIRCDIANKPSWALAERLGFKKERVIGDFYQAAGGYRDALEYSLSRQNSGHL